MIPFLDCTPTRTFSDYIAFLPILSYSSILSTMTITVIILILIPTVPTSFHPSLVLCPMPSFVLVMSSVLVSRVTCFFARLFVRSSTTRCTLLSWCYPTLNSFLVRWDWLDFSCWWCAQGSQIGECVNALCSATTIDAFTLLAGALSLSQGWVKFLSPLIRAQERERSSNRRTLVHPGCD